MLRTMSRIKRVCAMILVPRLFRGAGCTPGKFYRLKFDVIRKVKKSTSSDHTDHTKREEFRCKKCKKIIDYAFGPAEPYYSVDINKGTGTHIVHVNMCAKTQGPEDERLTHEKDAKIIAEWLKLNVQPSKDNNNATLLEDLKSKSLSDAKANVLLRVRNLDTILAAVEKKEKEINNNTAEGKDVNVVLQADAGEGKDEIKPHNRTTETKERLAEHTASATEGKALELHATAANKHDEEHIKLAPKIETISEVPLVEAAPRTDIFNPPKDSLLNVTRFEKPIWQENQSKMFDKIAQQYVHSPVKDIDRHLVKEISQLDLPPSQKVLNMSGQKENKLDPEVVKNASLDTKLNAVNTPELRTESVDNSEHISSDLKTEPIKPAESEIKIDPNSTAQRLVAQVNITVDKEIPADNLYCEFLGPAYEGRVALRDIGERPIDGYSRDQIESELSQCEHKQPCHLFRRTLIDVIHTTEPRNGLLVREYPVPRKVCFEAPRYITDPADRRTFDSKEWEYQDAQTALDYNEATKYSTAEKIEKEDDVQPSAGPILSNKQESIITSQYLSKEEAPTVNHILSDKQEGIVNNKELLKEEEPREPTRAAVEMAHTFIQAQPCAEPIHTRDHERKESVSSPITLDDSLPEINLNDTSVSLTELLRRVRERNRILYCREVGLQMAKNMAALNPEGKCGDKKPPCPPPQPKCPPPPPPCPPPPPPKCPPPCPPPKSKCPPPRCPPPCPPPPKCAPCPPPKNPCGKKDPCAKFKAHETITLVLHLGPLVNPGRQLLLPVLATNFIPAAPSSEESPVRGFLANLINKKLTLLRDILRYILEGRPNQLTSDMVLLRLSRTRDYTPWSPIPSWPYPVVNKKRSLQCPQEGCPVNPPVNPAPKFQRPCSDKPCLEFPKRPS